MHAVKVDWLLLESVLCNMGFFFAKTDDYLLLEVGGGFLKAQLRGIVWLRASSASHAGTDVDASHAGIKHSLKYANVGFSDLGHTRSHIMMKIRRDASASSRSREPLKNNRDPGYPSLFPVCLSVSPLAESFLVLMILAAYSWPVQSLTQRRTTEKAPLGNKRQGDKRKRSVSFVSIKGGGGRDLGYWALTSRPPLLSHSPDLNA